MQQNAGNSDEKGTNQYLLQGLIYKVEKPTLWQVLLRLMFSDYFSKRYDVANSDWEQAVLAKAKEAAKEHTGKNHPTSMKELVRNTIQDLASQPNSGIIGDDRDLKRRINVFGRNKKPSPIANGFFRSFMDEVQSKIWVVAGITALLSALFSGFTEGWKGITNGVALIVFALFVIIIVAFIDFLKDRQFINQQDLLKEESISVIRGKPFSTRSISVWDVVVGDVILIETGNRVPADCMIIESVGLTVDEPGDDMDYGEAIPKSDNLDIFLKAGSITKTGNAKAIVCAVGKDSTRGVKDEELDTSTKTQLEQKLQNLQNQILVFSAASAFVVFVQLIVFAFIAGAGTSKTSVIFARIAKAFNYTVVLAIASFPEGLPLTIVLALAFSIGQMYKKDKVLVRDNSAPEVMGKIQEVLVGKSGTITKGDMRVKKFLINQRTIQNSRKDTVLHCELETETILRIKESILFNTQARIEAGETTYGATGTPTDVAMINFLQDADIPVHLFIQRRYDDKKICELNIRSDQRWQAVAIKDHVTPEITRIYVKGAPEDILKMCCQHENRGLNYVENDGTGIVPFEPSQELGLVRDLAAKGLRCISFSYMLVGTDQFEQALEGYARNYLNKEQCFEKFLMDHYYKQQATYLMTLGLKDDLRTTVVDDVKYAKNTAFLQVRMVSNDMKETAVKVAQKAGILTAIPEVGRQEQPNARYQIMSGAEFSKEVGVMTQSAIGAKEVGKNDTEDQICKHPANMEKFREIVNSLVVLYRASAEHKRLLVSGLKFMDINMNQLDGESDQVKKFTLAQGMMRLVSVTGEGVNDVEALVDAHVGLAMGSGCSSSQENCQMVLVDNNFHSLIAAVQWGRNIFQNCTKFLQFQLTVNISLVLIIFIGIFFFSEPPMTPQMLLWINLIMDAFAAIALGTEPPIPAIVKGNPKEQTGLLKQKQVLRQIIGIGLWNVILTVLVFIFGGSAAGLDYKYFSNTNLAQPDKCPKPTSQVDILAKQALNKGTSKTTTTTAKKVVYSKDCTEWREGYAKKKMFTYVFCIFIFSHLFNMINCRKIGAADTHVFERFFHNYIFLIMFAVIAVGQVILVNTFNSFIGSTDLSKSEWGACITLGAMSLIISFVLKFTPGSWVEFLDVSAIGVDEDNAEANAIAGQIAAATQGKIEFAQEDDGTAADIAVEDEIPGDEYAPLTNQDDKV